MSIGRTESFVNAEGGFFEKDIAANNRCTAVSLNPVASHTSAATRCFSSYSPRRYPMSQSNKSHMAHSAERDTWSRASFFPDSIADRVVLPIPAWRFCNCSISLSCDQPSSFRACRMRSPTVIELYLKTNNPFCISKNMYLNCILICTSYHSKLLLSTDEQQERR